MNAIPEHQPPTWVRCGPGVMLAKDLRRARRNPVAFLIHLAVPLLITALIGMAFGGGGGGAGRIRLGVVDEDDSILTSLLRGAFNQGEGAKYLEPVFLDRSNALQQVGDGKLSAVIILPPGFTRDYLASKAHSRLSSSRTRPNRFIRRSPRNCSPRSPRR